MSRQDISSTGHDTRFKKGVSGNPKGMEKGTVTAPTKFKKFLEGLDEWEVEIDGKVVVQKLTREEILMYRLYDIAKSGDPTKYGETNGVSVAAIKELHDRLHGKPTQPTEITGKDGAPIGFSTSNLTTEEKRELLKLAAKARKNE